MRSSQTSKTTHHSEPLRALPIALSVFVASLCLAFVGATLVLPAGRSAVVLGLIALFALTMTIKPIPNPTGGFNVPNLGIIVTAAVLWEPGEALWGIGIGLFLGNLVLRRNELWRSVMNGGMMGLPGAAGALAAHTVIRATPAGVASLAAAALVAVITYRIMNMGLFATYRCIRFRRPFLRDWGANILANWPSQLLSAPVAVIAALAWARIGGGIGAGLAITAASALILPLARQELLYYYQSKKTLDEIVEAIMRALDYTVPEARAHAERVSLLAVETGRRLGLSESSLDAIRLAAHLHDVGQLADSAGPMDLNHHADAGARILARFPDPRIAEMVRLHHRLADSTYDPTSEKSVIPLGAHILAAAEAYDSCRTGLAPFEAPRTHKEASRYLTALSRSALDRRVVRALLAVVKDRELVPTRAT